MRNSGGYGEGGDISNGSCGSYDGDCGGCSGGDGGCDGGGDCGDDWRPRQTKFV